MALLIDPILMFCAPQESHKHALYIYLFFKMQREIGQNHSLFALISIFVRVKDFHCNTNDWFCVIILVSNLLHFWNQPMRSARLKRILFVNFNIKLAWHLEISTAIIKMTIRKRNTYNSLENCNKCWRVYIQGLAIHFAILSKTFTICHITTSPSEITSFALCRTACIK